MVIDTKGNLHAVRFTSGNVDDRNPVPEMLYNFKGRVYENKGYISQELFNYLFEKGITFVTGIKSKMKNKLMPLFDKYLLRKRSLIETTFSVLKRR